MELWTLDQLARRYPGLGSPSQIIGVAERLEDTGLSSEEARAHALDFDLACMWFGRWVEARAQETVERPVSAAEKRRQTKRVPKYPTLLAQLGMTGDGAAQGPDTPEETADEELTQKVDELRKNPQALVDFLRVNGEG